MPGQDQLDRIIAVVRTAPAAVTATMLRPDGGPGRGSRAGVGGDLEYTLARAASVSIVVGVKPLMGRSDSP